MRQRRHPPYPPTIQLIAGSNGPSFLQVHRSTGESPEEVAARKHAAAWGAWLDVPFDAEAAAAAREAAAAAEEAEEGAEGGEVATAAAALVQLEGGAAAAKAQPRRRSGRRSSAAKAAAGSSKARAALPEGAGAAMLVWAAVRWYRLSAAFCAAAQVRRVQAVGGCCTVLSVCIAC